MKKATVLLITLIVIGGCTGFIGGCRLPRVMSPAPPKESKKVLSWREKTVTKPKAVIVGNGRTVVVVSEETKTLEIDAKEAETEKALTWWQRMCGWFGSLSTIAIIVVVGGLFLGTTGPLMFLVRGFLRAKSSLKGVVNAIKDSGAVNDSNSGLHDALNVRLSPKDMAYVATVKSKL